MLQVKKKKLQIGQTENYKKPLFIQSILECLNSRRVENRDRQVEEGTEEALRLQ